MTTVIDAMLAAFRRCSRFRRSTGVAPASVAAGCAADDEGFSLVELLIAMGITLSILGAAFTVVGEWQIGFGAANERVDQQQRLRVAVDAISRDLALAGAGPHVGTAAGPLGFAVASVFPFRQGALFPDVPGTARTDTLTVLYVLPQTAAQTTVRQPVAARSGTVFINHDAGCPPSDVACGFGVGTDVMVYDDTGSYDTFRVTAVQSGILELQHNMLDTAGIYAAGARIVEAASHTYSLKTDPRTGTVQLVRYDGVSSEAAVVDHLVGLAFDYFGDPAPPLLIRPVTEPVGPWTSYGPKPPRLGVRSTAYAAGENCAFQVDAESGLQVARLPQLGGGSTTLVRLTEAELTDGPWCPDDTNPHRYDADLLRIRRVSVTLRVEASLSALRGPAGILFARGGSSRSAIGWVADQEIRFDIAPQNLTVSR